MHFTRTRYSPAVLIVILTELSVSSSVSCAHLPVDLFCDITEYRFVPRPPSLAKLTFTGLPAIATVFETDEVFLSGS